VLLLSPDELGEQPHGQHVLAGARLVPVVVERRIATKIRAVATGRRDHIVVAGIALRRHAVRLVAVG
jgi:hypothetical protein